MNICITPAKLQGSIKAPSSKSELHRLLIAAALAKTPCCISGQATSADILATIRCLQALGCGIKQQAGQLQIMPLQKLPQGTVQLNCGESGTTLRLLLPVVAALGITAEFSGSGRLPERPLHELITCLEQQGAHFSARQLPFTLSGRLRPGKFLLPGHISSQYISGLLLALPLLQGESQLQLTTPLQSASYVQITCQVLRQFGICCSGDAQSSFRIAGGQCYTAAEQLCAEGDWSNAAFFLAAGALCGNIELKGLQHSSAQGDRQILDLLRACGADISSSESGISVHKAKPLQSCRVDMADIPDLLPVLAVAAAAAEGESCFFNAERLRLKESDRLESTAAMLRALGGSAHTEADKLIIRGHGSLQGGTVDACNDHRIAMAASIAACICEQPVSIIGAECINKSYPEFYQDYISLGGIINGI